MDTDIIWITIDSLRYDHTSLSDYDRETTPNLARIADLPDARSFSQCFSNGSWTKPSVSSMLTGTYSCHHKAGLENEVIPPQIDTVPELLSKEGYHTICISEIANVGPASGLDRGFDTYRSLIEESKPRLFAESPRAIWRFLREHLGDVVDADLATTEDQKAVMRWVMPYFTLELLDKHLRSDRSNFIYCHFLGPHTPYHPPKQYQRRFDDGILEDVDVGEFARKISKETIDLIAGQVAEDESFRKRMVTLYDAEVRFVDELVGAAVETVRNHLDDPIVIVTADHGEELGNRNLIHHGHDVSDANTNVPLVTYNLGEISVASDDIVQHIDIVRTLVEMGGGDTDGLHGYDLREEQREEAFVSRKPVDFKKYTQVDETFDPSSYHGGEVHALRGHEFKLVSGSVKTSLYELPDEMTDVSDDHEEVAADMGSRLSALLSEYGEGMVTNDQADLSEEARQQLEDLGYT